MKKEETLPTEIEGTGGSSTQVKSTTSFTGGGTYEIEVEGHLDQHWSEWLGDLAIKYDNQGNTQLTGTIPDQSALHGILVQIRDLGLPLISLKRLNNEMRD